MEFSEATPIRSPSLTIPMTRLSGLTTGTPLMRLVCNSLAISRTGVSGTTVTTSVVMTSAAVNMASSHGFAREWPPPRHIRARATLPGGRLIKRLLTRPAGYSAPARQLDSLTGAIPDAFYGGLGMRPASR